MLNLQSSFKDGCRTHVVHPFNISHGTNRADSLATGRGRCHELHTVSCSSAFRVPATLKRSEMKTLSIVQLVESSSGNDAPILRKATRLVASTLLDALDDRIRKRRWQAALKVFRLLREQQWYQPDIGTHIKLIDMLGRCRKPEMALMIFNTMLAEKCTPTVNAYTALLTAYTRNSLLDKAFALLQEMKNAPGCQPDVCTYSEMIRACSDVKDFDRVSMLLCEMRNTGLTPNTVTYNILINAYGKAGMFTEMENLFMEMVEGLECFPDARTPNILLWSYARIGNIEFMEYWFVRMQELGFEPNIVTFNSLLTAYGRKSMFAKIESVLDFMHIYHYSGNTRTYNIVIDAYGKAGNIMQVKEIYREMLMKGIREDVHTFSALIDAYGKQGIYTKVEKILRQMRNSNIDPDTAVYNAALDAYRRANRKVEMHQVLLEMEDRGIEGDVYTKAILELALMDGHKSSTLHLFDYVTTIGISKCE